MNRPLSSACLGLLVRRYFLCPQLDCAAADVIAPFCSSEINSASRKLLAVWATHETYLPWFFHGADEPRGPAQGQSWVMEQPVFGSMTVLSELYSQRSPALATPSPSISASHTSPAPSPSKREDDTRGTVPGFGGRPVCVAGKYGYS